MKKREFNKIINSWKNKKTKLFDPEKMRESINSLTETDKTRLAHRFISKKEPFPVELLTDEVNKTKGMFGYYFIRQNQNNGVDYVTSEEAWMMKNIPPRVIKQEELNDPLEDHNYDNTFEDAWKKNKEESFNLITKPLVKK